MKLRVVTGIMLTLLMASIVIVSVGTATPIPTIAQTNSTATVYLVPPTINGTVVGQEFTVNIMISDSPEIHGWQVGINFNGTLLNCTGFYEGEFLSDAAGPPGTFWVEGTINNDTGVIIPYSCCFIGKYKTSGDGRLAYATFEVIAPGVSDLHLSGVLLTEYPPLYPYPEAPCNIIDVYTVVVAGTPHTVVTVSNSTSTGCPRINGYALIVSGFSDHAFIPCYGISFKVESLYWGFSNVTIPETLMSGGSDEWTVVLDGTPLSIAERTVTYNGTHYSVYFTYSNITYTHTIEITSPHVIPEFPSAIILPLFMILSLLTVVSVRLKKKKQ